MADEKPKRRWYRLLPDRFVIALLVVQCLLWLSERFQWPTWHKGYAVLIAVAAVGVVFVVMLLWLVASLLFRWRFQFSIRSLLVLTVAVALPFSWLAVKMTAAREQKEALDAVATTFDLQAAGALVSVKYDYEVNAFGDTIPGARPPGPAWLSSVLGDDFFAEVVSIYVSSFQHVPGADALLEHVKGLDQLQELGLDYTEVTDAGLVNLKRLSQLQHLGLEDTKVTDAGLLHLEGLTRLYNLNLRGTQVGDAGLAHLTRLPSLQWLMLDDTRVTDAGLENLACLGQLKGLTLRGTRVTDKGMKKLQQALPNCEIEH